MHKLSTFFSFVYKRKKATIKIIILIVAFIINFYQEKIIQLDGSTWRKIFADASKLKLIATPAEASALKTAMKIPLRIPTDFQCVALLNLLVRLEENGHTYF